MYEKCWIGHKFVIFYLNYYRRVIGLQKGYIPGVRSNPRAQFTAVKVDQWNIPSQLSKCYLKECGQFNT